MITSPDTVLSTAKMLWTAESNAMMQSQWDARVHRDLALTRSKQAYEAVSSLLSHMQSKRSALNPSGRQLEIFKEYEQVYVDALALLLSRSRSPDIRIAYATRCLASFDEHWETLAADVPGLPDSPPDVHDPRREQIEDKVREVLSTIHEASSQIYDLATKLAPPVAIAINHFAKRWWVNEDAIELTPIPPLNDPGTLPIVKPQPPSPPKPPIVPPRELPLREQEKAAVNALKERFPIFEKLPAAAEVLDSGLLLISVTIAVWHTIDADGKYASTAAFNLSGIVGGLAGAWVAGKIMGNAAEGTTTAAATAVESAVTSCMEQIATMVGVELAADVTSAAASVAVGVVTFGIGLLVGTALTALLNAILNLCWGLGHEFPPSMLVRMSVPMNASMHARMTAF